MPERSSARILIGFWFLFAIVISSSYNAMLTSYTNFPPKTRPIRNLEQLSRAVERNSIKLCIVKNRFLREVVSYHLSLKSRVLRDQLDEALRAAVCTDTLCCLRKVAAGTHVFFTNREEARLNTGKTFRGAVRADEDFVLVHVVMLAPRSSPYTEAFARVTRQLTETGVSAFSQKLRKFWHIKNTATWKEQVNRGKGSSFRVLRLTDLCGMIVVWGVRNDAGTVRVLLRGRVGSALEVKGRENEYPRGEGSSKEEREVTSHSQSRGGRKGFAVAASAVHRFPIQRRDIGDALFLHWRHVIQDCVQYRPRSTQGIRGSGQETVSVALLKKHRQSNVRTEPHTAVDLLLNTVKFDYTVLE
ncbi:hypothetical protein MRX96_032798 [Rhipicephalus microplus]